MEDVIQPHLISIDVAAVRDVPKRVASKQQKVPTFQKERQAC
jgi:hypothetical protein